MRRRELQEVLWEADDVLDLAELDGLTDEDGEVRATEMLSFRVDVGTMAELREAAESLGVGHTILARELLRAGLKRLRILAEE